MRFKKSFYKTVFKNKVHDGGPCPKSRIILNKTSCTAEKLSIGSHLESKHMRKHKTFFKISLFSVLTGLI